MSVLVVYSNSPEGRAALQHGHHVAQLEQLPLVAMDLDHFAGKNDRNIAAPIVDEKHAEIPVQWLGRRRDDPDAADELLDTSEEIGAVVIVVGIKRRSAVGKLLLGSNAQRILLGADVPVIAVKAAQHEH